MFKVVLLIHAAHCVGAVNMRVKDDTDIARAADEEIQGLQDLSNKGLWQEAWKHTAAKHASLAMAMDDSQSVLYPEAQVLFQNLVKARHRLKTKMQEQQEEEKQKQDAQNDAQQQEHQFEEDTKAGFLQRMTAGINDVIDLPSATTTKTTTEDPQVVKEREHAAEIKEKEMAKMTAGVAETKEESAPQTTTTTEDPAAKAEREHMEQLREAEMAKLTSGMDGKSVAAAGATVTTTVKTTTTTTTTTTLNAAGKKMMADLLSGKFYKHSFHMSKNFAGLQTSENEPEEDNKQDDDSNYSETMTDVDEYGF
eukprot:gnl/MRDRNA2_/MRDRNA2_28865_c0_seq1.p1 gnl/MRDRNA2_/MRDRNA2_28865_c0~~gnl/MRDRNA2_/MRDRNA2_28865_c0_seq1.p1  ORF type:complete len:309 (-),score=95.12 gnl/MRDRNA2_/MRDRNA2_28865_c0_seq1:183-1109(-)